MRKAIAAVSVGLLLIAGQAAASGANPAAVKVGDRVGGSGAATQDSPYFTGGYIVPVIIILTLGLGIYVATEDDGDS